MNVNEFKTNVCEIFEKILRGIQLHSSFFFAPWMTTRNGQSCQKLRTLKKLQLLVFTNLSILIIFG